MRVLLLAVMLGTLAACGVFKGKTNKENIEPPAALVEFESRVEVDQLWSTSLGDGEGKLGLRQAVAVDGSHVFAATLEGELLALDASTGKQLWAVESTDRWSAGPGLGEATLAVGSLDGVVAAFSPDNGSERWRAKVSSEIVTAPAIGRGLVVVRVNDGRVFAFSTIDGERKWVYDRGLPSLTLRGNSRPLIAGDTVYLGYDSGVLVALRLSDGAQQWEQVVAEGEGRNELDRMVDIDGDLILNGSEVYAASFNGQILAMDAPSGRPLWNREMSVFAGLNLAGDRLLVSDNAGTVWALDRRTGASLWRQDGLANRWLTTPVVVGNYVVVGDIEGYLHWLILDSGEFAGREKLDGDPIRAVPQVFGDVVYAQTIEGKLAAFRAVAR